jgi:hypothetical protein
VKIASQHSEAVGEAARVGVEKRLLFDGIALHAPHVTPRHVESAALVVSNLTDPELAVRNRAAVPTGVAAHPISVELLVKLALANVIVDDFSKCWHSVPLGIYFRPFEV